MTRSIGLPSINIGIGCVVCVKMDALMRCARCKKVEYYSREHQRVDWKTQDFLYSWARSNGMSVSGSHPYTVARPSCFRQTRAMPYP